jgi:hypothetical protein
MHRTIVLIVLTGAVALAQVSTGSLSGNVRDESGGTVPEARIVARQAATGFERTAVTDQSG